MVMAGLDMAGVAEATLQFTQITSAKVCSVFLKYQMPDATRSDHLNHRDREPRPVDAALSHPSRHQRKPSMIPTIGLSA